MYGLRNPRLNSGNKQETAAVTKKLNKINIALFFLTLISWALSLPADIPSKSPGELYLSNLIPRRVYVEPISADISEKSSKIVGGSEVTPNSVPHHVAVIIEFASFCAGSLISTDKVLTAAHCTNDAAFVQVILGAHHINVHEATQVRLTSTNILIHENYNVGVFMANDVSIIFLHSPVTPTEAIATITLAPANSGTFAGSAAFLSGWKTTSDEYKGPFPGLQGVNLSVITNNECARSYANLILSSNLCTSGVGNVGAWSGDPGGALVVDGVQVGLVSFGSTHCEAQHPTVYARISYFRGWISEHARV